MRNDDHRVLATQTLDRLDNLALGRHVQSRSSLVKDQHLRTYVQRTGNRNALTLPPGQLYAAFTKYRVQTLRQRRHKLVKARRGQGLPQSRLVNRIRIDAKRDVRTQRVVQKIHVLGHVPDLTLP